MIFMIQDKVRDLLLTIPSAKLVSGGKEINLRCRYCPDSRNLNSAHMYINLGYNNTPMYHNCFKCHSKGILTYEKLLEWTQSIDIDAAVEMINYNKSILSMPQNRRFKDSEIYKLYNDTISETQLSYYKLKYINDRLGVNLDFNELLKRKIVLNIGDLLDRNKITSYTRHDNIMRELNDNFLGFISEDNAFINLRKATNNPVYKGIDKRYVVYNIFNKFDNSRKNYIMPCNINMYDIKRIKVHIAEGPFDILSIFYNLRQDEYNNIYCAITGNSYLNMCKHFINTLKLINIEFHIYPDNDVEDYIFNINAIINLCNTFQIPLYLHKNKYPGEKDFGVSVDRIKEEIIRVV